MVPVWSLVLALVVGLLAGGGLVWLLKPSLRTPASTAHSEPRAPEPEVVVDQPAAAEPVAQTPGDPVALAPAPRDEPRATPNPPPPAPAPQPEPEPAPEPATSAVSEERPADEPSPPADAPVRVSLPDHLARPVIEPEEHGEGAAEEPEAATAGGEHLDQRMGDVLSELERRYEGRRVEEGRPEKPAEGSGARPRRRPRKRT